MADLMDTVMANPIQTQSWPTHNHGQPTVMVNLMDTVMANPTQIPAVCGRRYIARVGQNHTFIGIYGVCTVFLAGKLPYIRSYTV